MAGWVDDIGWRWSVDVKPIVCIVSARVTISASRRRGVLVEMPDGAVSSQPGRFVRDSGPVIDAWARPGDERRLWIDFEAMRTRREAVSMPRYGRCLASILVTVTSLTRRAARPRWERSAGQLGATTGRLRTRSIVIAAPRQDDRDGVLAQSEAPTRGPGRGRDREASRSLDLEIRAGVHSGEVQVTPDDVRGIAVHTAARIMSVAGPGEILVSATVMDLVDGSELRFADAGSFELKGLHGARRLYRLV